MIKLVKHICWISLLSLSVSGCFRNVPDTSVTLVAVEMDSVSVFDRYDFNSGEYELFGEYWSEFNRNSLADSIGQFYISDSTLLNHMKANWHFKLTDGYDCGYDYVLYLTKNDSVVETFKLNIGCNSLVSEYSHAYITRSYVEELYGKTDSIEVYRVVFHGQDLAVDYLKTMREDSTIFVLDNGGYVWENYIGYFEVTYSNPKIQDKQVALAEVQKGITKKYKTADFELENIGSNNSTGTYKIRVYCDKKLADGFDLYPLRKEYSYIINYSMKGFKRL